MNFGANFQLDKSDAVKGQKGHFHISRQLLQYIFFLK